MDREEDQVYKQKKQHGNKNNDTSYIGWIQILPGI